MSLSTRKPPIVVTLIIAIFMPALAQAAYPYQDANLAVETRVNDLLPRMTLDEKVGQMTQALSNIAPANITTYFIGSILSGGGDGPGGNNSATEWADLYDSFQTQGIGHPAGHSHYLRNRCRSRPQQSP